MGRSFCGLELHACRYISEGPFCRFSRLKQDNKFTKIYVHPIREGGGLLFGCPYPTFCQAAHWTA